MDHDLANVLEQCTLLLQAVRITFEDDVGRAEAIRQHRTVPARAVECGSEPASGGLPRDEAHERLAGIEHPIAPPLTRRWRSGVHLARTERDHGPRDVYVLGAAKEGACRA